MIKINLLESVTDRPKGAALVEEKVANPRVQTLLLALTVFGLMALGMGYEYISSNSAHSAATEELAKQKRINEQMLAVQREQMELEKKAQEIQARIDAIKRLRESQQGPSAVLQEIKARFDSVPELYLVSIEQKDGEVTIKGLSPNEYAVTKFGQSLEFSGGLFSNLFIETQLEVAKESSAEGGAAATPADQSGQIPVVAFTVKANFGSPKQQQNGKPAANQVANNMPPGAGVPIEKKVFTPPVNTPR
jgi:Tfp pilus assembly protein PilN